MTTTETDTPTNPPEPVISGQNYYLTESDLDRELDEPLYRRLRRPSYQGYEPVSDQKAALMIAGAVFLLTFAVVGLLFGAGLL